MASLQELKKKHKGIQSTKKLTKAMKTVSAAKHSALNRVYGNFSVYAKECMSLYKKYEEEINAVLPKCDGSSPKGVFVFSSNKGMCGGFNAELFAFFSEQKASFDENTVFFPCGKKAVAYFAEKEIPFEKSFVFSDIPTSDECSDFLNSILSMRENGEISSAIFIYPEYKNVMKQIPTMHELFTSVNAPEESEGNDTAEDILFFPDKKSVVSTVAKKVLFTSVYSVVAQCALGAQAATLTTMRSAYDTAVKYSDMLETQINRTRQAEVTADVLETSKM